MWSYFSQPFVLKEHVKNVNEPFYHFCDKCNFQCKRLRYLELNNEREHEGKLFLFNQCEYTAKFALRITDHERGVNVRIKYECDQCDYTSVFKRTIVQHTNVKHKKVRYPCCLCGYKATRCGNLRTHIRYVHMGEKRSTITSETNLF